MKKGKKRRGRIGGKEEGVERREEIKGKKERR